MENIKEYDLIHNGLYIIDKDVARYDAAHHYFFRLDGRRLGYVTSMQRSHALACDIMTKKPAGGVDFRKHHIYPLKLTKEILEKNGFRYEHNYGSFYRSILGDYAKDKEPVVSIGWANGTQMCEWDIADGHRGASYGHNVLHVHQFQQALRICGLKRMADNFKV